MLRARITCCLLFALTLAPVLAAQERMPSLIRKNSPSVQRGWRQADDAIRENERLKKPLPEPYLSRAEIWSLVGNHEDALADQLKAVELLFQRRPSLVERARYLKRMHDTLESLRSMPRPFYPAHADEYYYLGRTAYFERSYRQAVDDLTEAIRLNPEEPLFWYYRALAYTASGDESKAVRDARVGASLRRAGKSQKNIPGELERIQGCLRLWLNEAEEWRPAPQPR